MRISDWSSDVCSSDLIFELRAQRLLEPDDRAIVDQVDQALEAALDADRQIEHGRTSAEAVLAHADAHLEIRAGAVELVDEAHAGNPVLLGLAPHGLGLRLEDGHAVSAAARPAQHAPRPPDTEGEAHLPGRAHDDEPG